MESSVQQKVDSATVLMKQASILKRKRRSSMFSEGLNELLGISDHELMRLLAKARAERKEEIEFVVNGEQVKLKLNHINPDHVIDLGNTSWSD